MKELTLGSFVRHTDIQNRELNGFEKTREISQCIVTSKNKHIKQVGTKLKINKRYFHILYNLIMIVKIGNIFIFCISINYKERIVLFHNKVFIWSQKILIELKLLGIFHNVPNFRHPLIQTTNEGEHQCHKTLLVFRWQLLLFILYFIFKLSTLFIFPFFQLMLFSHFPLI